MDFFFQLNLLPPYSLPLRSDNLNLTLYLSIDQLVQYKKKDKTCQICYWVIKDESLYDEIISQIVGISNACGQNSDRVS